MLEFNIVIYRRFKYGNMTRLAHKIIIWSKLLLTTGKLL